LTFIGGIKVTPLLQINVYEYGCHGFRQIFLGQGERIKKEGTVPQTGALIQNQSLVMTY
jgi:hypothetical protein